jgi:hypothetical protein
MNSGCGFLLAKPRGVAIEGLKSFRPFSDGMLHTGWRGIEAPIHNQRFQTMSKRQYRSSAWNSKTRATAGCPVDRTNRGKKMKSPFCDFA